MSSGPKQLIQSSESMAEARRLTGRDDPITLHGYVLIQPEEEISYQVISLDQYERHVCEFRTILWSACQKYFEHMDHFLGAEEDYRRMDIVLTDLSVIEGRNKRTVSLAGGEPWDHEVEVYTPEHNAGSLK